MSSFGTLSLMARIAYYSKSIIAHILSAILDKRHVAVFMFIRTTGSAPEFLQVFHEDWGCHLFPGALISPDGSSSEDWIAERCGRKVGLTASTQVSFDELLPQRKDQFDFASFKRSGSDLTLRVYFYKFYLVKLRDPKKWSSFEQIVANNQGTQWMTYNQLQNDRKTYMKNKDIIDHLAVKMNKGYGVDSSEN